MAAVMADIALGLSGAFGGPYHDALAKWPGTPVLDDGGSISTPGTPVSKTCSAQGDRVTESMRLADGYRDKDIRLLVLAGTLDGALDTNATVEVLEGPHAGTWSVESAELDPAGIVWDCRGRRHG